MKWIFCFLIMVFSQISFAGVILFIDTNNATTEIAAAKRAAQARGDQLVVFPPAGKKYIADADGDLKYFLVDLMKKNKSPQSLIVSGHSSGFTYSGERMGIGVEDITYAFKEASRIAQKPNAMLQVHSLYLFGCYSGTPETFLLWKKNFPKLKIGAGFSGRAPLSTAPGVGHYIEDLLKREDHAMAICELKQTSQYFHRLDKPSSHVSVCIDNYFVDSKDEIDLNHWEKLCGDGKKAALFDRTVKVYEAYYYGGTQKPDVPADTGHSDLRDYYSDLRRLSICFKQGDHTSIPNLDQVLRLIFFKNIRNNFSLFYSKKLEQMSKFLEGNQVCHWKPIEQMGRYELYYGAFSSCLSLLFQAEKEGVLRNYNFGNWRVTEKHEIILKDQPGFSDALATAHLLDNLVMRLEPQCLDMHWIEPLTKSNPLSPPPSKCEKEMSQQQ